MLPGAGANWHWVAYIYANKLPHPPKQGCCKQTTHTALTMLRLHSEVCSLSLAKDRSKGLLGKMLEAGSTLGKLETAHTGAADFALLVK